MLHRVYTYTMYTITLVAVIAMGVHARTSYIEFAASNGENGTVYGTVLGAFVFLLFGTTFLYILAPSRVEMENH